MRLLSEEAALYVKNKEEKNMIPSEKWRPRCKCCGRTGGTISGLHGKPNRIPTIPSKCPNTPDGKHRPEWEKC